MLMKIAVVVFFVFIVYSLASALHRLLKHQADNEDSARIVKALTWRIGLSILLFIFIIVAYELGWLVPTAFSV